MHVFDRSDSKLKTFVELSLSLLSLIALIFCSYKLSQALTLSSGSVSLFSITGSVEINNITFDGTTLTPDLVFNSTEDSITYKLLLVNDDHTEYKINSITDNNQNNYIKTSYSFDDTNSPEDKEVFLTLAYDEYLPYDGNLDLSDINVTLNLQVPDDTSITPDYPDSLDNPDISESLKDPENQKLTIKRESDDVPAVPDTGHIYFSGAKTLSPKRSIPYLLVAFFSLGILIILILPRFINPALKHRTSKNTKATAELFNDHNHSPKDLTEDKEGKRPKEPENPFGSASPLPPKVILLIGFFLAGSIFSGNVLAKPASLEFTIATGKIDVLPDLNDHIEIVSVDFPNIFNNISMNNTYTGAEAIIIRTLDDKYVLLDTGYKDGDVVEIIYNRLKEMQDSENVSVDYLIISHLDDDHFGNAVSLMNNDNISFGNLIIKHELYDDSYGSTKTYKEKVFNNVVETANNNNVSIITNDDDSSDKQLTEGMEISVGDYLKLLIFNTENVYEGLACKTGTRVVWRATEAARTQYYKTSSGEYVYFDGKDFPDVEFKLTDTYVQKAKNEETGEGYGLNRYFYAEIGSGATCASNVNSLGVFAEVKTARSNRYMYFPNDVENAGYSMLEGSGNAARIFENLEFVDGGFKTDITPYKIPSEINVANRIYEKLEKDAEQYDNLTVDDLLNNISIYQECHHGINNNKEAIDRLNLNRENGIYSIREAIDWDNSTNQAAAGNFQIVKTHNYILKDIPAENRLIVGKENQNGIRCSVNVGGGTICNSY